MLMDQWFKSNLDIIFFIYGLAFVGMGIAIWAQPKKGSSFKLASILWLLAGFGFIHGANEFLDMWAIIKGQNPIFDIIRSLALIISYLFLFEFSRRLFRICGQKYLEGLSRVFGWWMTLAITLVIFTLGFKSGDFWKTGTIWARYLLGFPGCIFLSISFISYYQYEKKELAALKVKKYFFWAGISFFTYGLLGGLVVPKADFFPSNLLNTDYFFSVTGVPVQGPRAVIAIIIAWSICGILRIFNWETVERLKREIGERKRAEKALQGINLDLEARVRQRAEELQNTCDELRETQFQLVQSAKMASVGQLAGGIAHEINNPLTGVLNNVQLIKLEVQINKKEFNPDAFRRMLDIVEESALRCKKITDSLLGFSRAATGRFVPVSVNDLVKRIADIVAYEMKAHNISLQIGFPDRLPQVLGEPQLLQQVIFDLVNNAKWAVEKKAPAVGGTITISASPDASGRRLLISVADNGIGIAPENLKKIFEPFFTTKPEGEGTGLGLSIVHNIIKQHNGDIGVESKPGEGTVFEISLPVLGNV